MQMFFLLVQFFYFAKGTDEDKWIIKLYSESNVIHIGMSPSTG